MKLAAYIRVSTEGQVDAFGKDIQREAINRWAALNGHVVEAYYAEDAVSGKTDGGERPVLRELLENSKSFDGVVAFDATRIARRLVVQETLLALVWATGLRVFTTTAGELTQDEEDPTKVLIRQILGVIAEFDHRTTVAKLQAGRRHKRDSGGFVGGHAPFGMSVVGVGKSAQLVVDDEEARVITQIRARHAAGQSLRRIADGLNSLAIPSKTGKLWSAPQIQRIIKRYENI